MIAAVGSVLFFGLVGAIAFAVLSGKNDGETAQSTASTRQLIDTNKKASQGLIAPSDSSIGRNPQITSDPSVDSNEGNSSSTSSDSENTKSETIGNAEDNRFGAKSSNTDNNDDANDGSESNQSNNDDDANNESDVVENTSTTNSVDADASEMTENVDPKKIEQLALTDGESSPEGKPIDLLRLIEYPQNLRSGIAIFPNFRARHGSPERGLRLLSPHAYNMVEFPILLPRAYDIRAKVTRLDLGENDSLWFVFHIDGHPVTFVFDSGEVQISGLVAIDDKSMGHPDYDAQVLNGMQLPIGVPIDLLIRVRPRGFELLFDNESIYRWVGDPARLSAILKTSLASEYKYRLVVASFKSGFLIEQMELIPRGHAATDRNWESTSTAPKILEKPQRKVVDLLKKFNLNDGICSHQLL